MDYVGIINILMDAGAEVDALRDFMRQLMESTITKEEKLQYLRRQRQKLLADIHSKQKIIGSVGLHYFWTPIRQPVLLSKRKQRKTIKMERRFPI